MAVWPERRSPWGRARSPFGSARDPPETEATGSPSASRTRMRPSDRPARTTRCSGRRCPTAARTGRRRSSRGVSSRSPSWRRPRRAGTSSRPRTPDRSAAHRRRRTRRQPKRSLARGRRTRARRWSGTRTGPSRRCIHPGDRRARRADSSTPSWQWPWPPTHPRTRPARAAPRGSRSGRSRSCLRSHRRTNGAPHWGHAKVDGVGWANSAGFTRQPQPPQKSAPMWRGGGGAIGLPSARTAWPAACASGRHKSWQRKWQTVQVRTTVRTCVTLRRSPSQESPNPNSHVVPRHKGHTSCPPGRRLMCA